MNLIKLVITYRKILTIVNIVGIKNKQFSIKRKLWIDVIIIANKLLLKLTQLI